MLTDLKQEIEPKQEVETPRKSPVKSIQPAVPTHEQAAPRHTQHQDEEEPATFGWEQIENGPLIPYIVRGCAKFVACHIIVEKLFKVIRILFSNEMINCVDVMRHSMTRSEAKAFNEININHCDKGVVGTYLFKPGDLMVDTDSVQKFVNYYYACRSLTLLGVNDNNLFGFLRIAGQNEVPFVWNDNQKLVPLLYFEGQSEYVDLKSQVLEDYWKIGYLKFCFKVQKVRPQLYTENPIKVINIKDVEILFPADTTFEVCCPKEVDKVVFASSIKLPNAMANETAKRSVCGYEEIHSKRPKINQSQAQKALTDQPANQTGNIPNYTVVSHAEYERLVQQNIPQHIQKFIPSQQAFSNQIILQNQDYCTDKSNFRYTSQLTQLAAKSQSQTIETFSPAHKTFKQYSAINKLQQPYYSHRPTETHQMTNVPSISPAAASSPGIRQTSPFMTEAVIERYPQGNSLLGREYQNNLQQQTQSPYVILPYANQCWQQPNVPVTNIAVHNPTTGYQTKEATVALVEPSTAAEIQSYALNAPNMSNWSTVHQNVQQLEVNKRNTQQKPCKSNCSCRLALRPSPNTTYDPYDTHFNFGNAALSKPPNMILNISAEPHSNVFPSVNRIPPKDKELIDINHIADEDWCVTKNCPVNKINLLGIKKSRNSDEWLVNFSELADKILSVNSDKNKNKLTSLFKTFYSLRSPTQITKWNKALKENKIRVDQRYEAAFIDYSEAKLVMKNLSSKIFKVYTKTSG